MFISFIFGVFAGVLVMAVNQINKVNEYEKIIEEEARRNKKLVAENAKLQMANKKMQESRSYWMKNTGKAMEILKQDIDGHIPHID